MRTARPLLALALVAGACGAPAPSRCGPPGEAVPNEGWTHVPEGSAIAYRHNPPASGPHYPVWARYRIHAQVVPRGYWVHDLEHGALVLLYRPDASPDSSPR